MDAVHTTIENQGMSAVLHAVFSGTLAQNCLRYISFVVAPKLLQQFTSDLRCHRKDLSTGSRIHERTNLLMFLGIILRILRLEVSVYNVYITHQFKTTFAQGGRGVKIR